MNNNFPTVIASVCSVSNNGIHLSLSRKRIGFYKIMAEVGGFIQADPQEQSLKPPCFNNNRKSSCGYCFLSELMN